jgi:anti-anti-sigma factor
MATDHSLPEETLRAPVSAATDFFSVRRDFNGAARTDGTHRVSLRGELDIASVPTLESVFDSPAADAGPTLVLDLRELTFVDLAGIRSLGQLHARMSTADQPARVAPSESVHVRRMLQLAVVNGWLPDSFTFSPSYTIVPLVEDDHDAPFDRVGRLAVRVLDVPFAFVGLVSDEEHITATPAGWTMANFDAGIAAQGRAFTRYLAGAGVAVIVADVRADERTKGNAWLAALGIRSLAAYPLKGLGGEVLGMLCVATETPRQWTADALDLLAALADMAGMKAALRDAVRISDATALVLQHSMLTELPEVAGVELVARYVPAQESAQIGGDWYDAFVLPDGDTALIVGDVVGHDMPAAAKMGQLRNLLRGIATYSNAPPHVVVSGLDRTAFSLGVAELATVVYARLAGTPATGWQLSWANAGHPPPLLVAADGTARYLDAPSGILLSFGDGEHVDGVVPLPVGSTVLFFTDGLVESRILDVSDGLDALREAATVAASWPLPRLCDHLIAEVAGAGNADDVTLLAIRIRGADS